METSEWGTVVFTGKPSLRKPEKHGMMFRKGMGLRWKKNPGENGSMGSDPKARGKKNGKDL